MLIPLVYAAIVFPADAGVVDVTTYGAIPNDGKDDTEAIQRALNDHPTGNHIFYFPDGVYNVSGQIRYAGTEKRNILQGQSRDGTIIKLDDNSDLDTSVIWTGSPPAQRFRNSIRDLTVDIGRGNPNVNGIDFIANNQGLIRNVKIISRDGQGRIGLNLSIDENGPLLAKNIHVVGFDIGIQTWNPTASQTLENITLENQNQYGWKNFNQNVFVRGLQSTNEVTAVWNMPDGGSVFTLIDSELTGLGSASELPAIHNQKAMYVRQLRTSGYKQAILQNDKGRGNASQPDGYVREWIARGEFQSLFDSPQTMLNLPIKETPELPWHDLSDWVSPLAYGGNPNDGIDDTEAIQAAIDSGGKTVYLPNGVWDVNGTLELRGNVQRLIATEARIVGDGVIRVAQGTSPTVIIERVEAASISIVHESDRTLIISSSIVNRYSSTQGNGGDVYIEDVGGGPWVFTNQNVWMRQINPETIHSPRITNDGGSLWILGYKTEDEGTLVKTINGGKTEVLGGLILNGRFADIPGFINIDSSLSYANVGFLTFSGGSIPIGVQETRNGVTLMTDQLPPYYTGYQQPTSSRQSENFLVSLWRSILRLFAMV
ncbi:MAG: glycosyl hydrolase family 28-related protein [Arthrospira platensis PCC 7345]|nr:glycosyl hydrolase family 28-related protein [Arthrospira platensis PCC 7345]TVU54965.1 MAG: virulence protein [Arthrospira sp. PLM2.Bin9]